MRISRFIYGLLGMLCCWTAAISADDLHLKGVLFDQDQLAKVNLEFVKAFGYSTVVIVPDYDGESEMDPATTVKDVRSAGMGAALWIEIGRDPGLARAHPEWMASIQGHTEWRRFYPEFPETIEGEVVKVYPWVPISYEEAFDAQLKKVELIIEAWPSIQKVFLNDIQGAPSACGCGHPLCRWTADYGPIKTATPLSDDFAARFIESVKSLREDMEVIPVWATECEKDDKHKLCAGVGCFNGACWREWSAQLEPVLSVAPRIGALLLRETFQRPDSESSSNTGWLSLIPKSFTSMPEKYERTGVEPKRLVAVIEGWSSKMESFVPEQLEQLRTAGVDSFIVAQTKINQDWEPRVIKVPSKTIVGEKKLLSK